MEPTLWEQLQKEETRLAAFEKLVTAHYGQVKRWLLRWVGDEALAEDLAQETFLRAWENCHTFRGEAAFSSWLYTIARREALRALQHRRREGILPWLWGTENAPEEPAAEPIPDYERFHAAIAETVEALPPKQRAVFEAAWHEHLSYKAIAQRLGIRENTVKAHLYHVRQRLWKRLREWLSD